LVVGDNCSPDHTREVVAQFQDSRLKYIRHPQNIGALPNFRFLADQAKGEFLIIHQDDDLLHRDFLRNCYETVSANQEVVLYATPWWRGNPASGFKSKLLRDLSSKSCAHIVQDQPLILDGRTMAVSLLHSFYFAHPTLAFRRTALAAVGGYHSDPENISDVITEARVLCQGKLAYDPRIGGVFTDHGDNASRTMDKDFKILTYRNMYRTLVDDLESHGVDWRSVLEADFSFYSDAELMAVFSEWARYGAPKRLQLAGWFSLRQRKSLKGVRFYSKIFRKVGLGNMIRFCRTILTT
jgi:glycosyltransferase involved in cell wall biosynthesis